MVQNIYWCAHSEEPCLQDYGQYFGARVPKRPFEHVHMYRQVTLQENLAHNSLPKTS